MNMLTHTMSHRDYVDIHTHSRTLTKHTLICPQTQIQKHIHSHACTNTFIVSHKHADVCVCVCVCVSVLAAQSCPTLCDPMDCNCSCQALLSVGIRQARMLEWVARTPPGDLPDPGIEPRSATLQVDSLPSEPPGKPKTPGVGSLSLLQGIFPTQESKQDLLHCRQILYQLSYQGSQNMLI